jgi:hypothetical protein
VTPHEILRCASRRLLVLEVPDLGVRLVYLVRRVTASDLLDAGLAELPGAAEAATAAAKRWTETDRTALLNDCKTEKQRKALREKWAAEEAAEAQAALASLVGTPDKAAAFLARIDAHICAGVMAAGIAKDEVKPGVLPVGTEPPEVCEDPGDGKHVRPLRFVRGTPSAPDEMALTELSDADRMQLGMMIAAAFQAGVSARAETFRERAGDARADGRMGAEVRAAPERAPRDARRAGARRAAGARGGDAR